MRFDVITLFPDMVLSACRCGVTGRAVQRGQVQLMTWNPRDYTCDLHRTVDDRPYGGGPGMVMKFEPLHAAVQAAREAARPETRVVYLSPQGTRLNQEMVCRFAQEPGLILVAGRYEGVDERLIEFDVDEECSIGDFVLSGGELAALVVVDAVARLLPGVLGDEDSAQQDSHMRGVLDHPHYTRPETVLGRRVPEVLLSGNHEAIRQWRLRQSLGRTWLRRPDLIESKELTAEERQLLNEFIQSRAAGAVSDNGS